MTKWIISLVVLLAVGFASYKAGQRSVPAALNSEHIEEKIKTDLVELTKKDFEEYQNLKTLEDRYKKADEILGKIVTVFLADLGMRLNFKNTNVALLDASCGLPKPALAATVAPPPSSAPPMSTPVSAVAEAKPTPQPSLWQRMDRKIMSLSDEQAALEALKDAVIPDLFATLKTAKPIDNKTFQDIYGHFQGEIVFFDRKKNKSDWIIEWKLTQSNVPRSSYIYLTSKATGKTFSKTTGDGTKGWVDNNFSRDPSSKSIIVNVYADDGYIHIYPFNGNPSVWVGNYYSKKSLGEYELTGQVRVNRID